MKKKHRHYFRDVSHLKLIDIYRFLRLFGVTDPCIQHAVKKLVCAGDRGVKDQEKDINEAIDSLQRFLEMNEEDRAAEALSGSTTIEVTISCPHVDGRKFSECTICQENQAQFLANLVEQAIKQQPPITVKPVTLVFDDEPSKAKKVFFIAGCPHGTPENEACEKCAADICVHDVHISKCETCNPIGG